MSGPPSVNRLDPTHSPNSRHGFAVLSVFLESIHRDNFVLLLHRQSCVHDKTLVDPPGSGENVNHRDEEQSTLAVEINPSNQLRRHDIKITLHKLKDLPNKIIVPQNER